MAFDILRMFGPQAANRLMQPSFMGPPNMLEAPMAPQLPPPVNVGPAPAIAAPQPDPMQTASVAAPAPMQAAKPKAPGLGIDKELLNDIFLGWAMGQTPMQSLAMGAAQAAKGKGGRQNVNETVEWLKGRGMDEATARQLASQPTALSDYLKQMINPDKTKPLEINGKLVDPNTYQVIADFSEGPKPTDDMREYEAAKAQGFDGSFMDFMVKMKEAGRPQVNIDTGVKLPGGYQWVDPNDQSKGVQPIPGGPATQIPGELAARVGMSESFMQQAPALREKLLSGDMTGPIDSLTAKFGYGERGETYRQMQSGADALMRLLTGAGMNETEAKAYAERYLPTMKDTPESAAGKLDQLVRELEAAKGMAMRGRGGSTPAQPPATGGASPNVDDLVKKYGG